MSAQNIKKLQKIAQAMMNKLKILTKNNDNVDKEVVEATQHGIEINSDSQREALELFDNVAPVPENKAETKTKNNKKEKKEKKQLDEKLPQNNIKSILRQPIGMEEEKLHKEQMDQEIEESQEKEKENDQIFEEEEEKQMNEDQVASEKNEKQQKKAKSVSFNFDDNLIFSLNLDRKWNEPIQNQKKGKFQLYQQKALSDAIGQYLATNEIKFNQFVKWLSVGSKQEKHVLRKQKFFKLLSSVLPNRSPMSCYKFVTRNYNSLNHQGSWTLEQIDKLRSLVEKYGRQWTRIGKELGRTSDNVYDKYRSIGEEGLEERVKSLWKLGELVEMLLEIQRQTGIQFIDHNIKKELQSEAFHNGIQEKELKEHRYNSKLFTFHNIEVIRRYIDAKLFQGIQLDTIKWKKIVRKIPTKNFFDCRNKVVQILQVLFRNNESLDQSLVKFLQKQRATQQSKLQWKKWKSDAYSAEQAKNRFMIVKKLVQGRTVKPFNQIYREVINKIKKILEKPKEK